MIMASFGMAKTQGEGDLYYKLGEMHADIKNTFEQTLKTNGRVTKLESEIIPRMDRRIDDIDLRIAKYVGAVGVILFLIQMFGSKIINSL